MEWWVGVVLAVVALAFFEWRSWKSPTLPGRRPWDIPMGKTGPIGKHADLDKPHD